MKNILTAFAAVMISLLMLCGCSEDDVGEIEETYVGTDISRYIDSIGEEPTEKLSETVSEDDTETSYGETSDGETSDGETSDGEMSDGEKSNDEISDSETAAETVISDEITSADIPEASEDDLSETERLFRNIISAVRSFSTATTKSTAQSSAISRRTSISTLRMNLSTQRAKISCTRPKRRTATSSITTPKLTSSLSFPRTDIYGLFSNRAQVWTIGKDSNTKHQLIFSEFYTNS